MDSSKSIEDLIEYMETYYQLKMDIMKIAYNIKSDEFDDEEDIADALNKTLRGNKV